MSVVKEDAEKSIRSGGSFGSDKGNMLDHLDDTEVDFDKDNSDEEQDDRVFAMGKDGVHFERSNQIFHLAKSRDLLELEAKDYLFNKKVRDQDQPLESSDPDTYKQAYFYLYGMLTRKD